MRKPSFDIEQSLWEKGYKYIAGVDEVGRGCFAGPLVASAVILSPEFIHEGVNDSKVLSPIRRQKLDKHIRLNCQSFAISEISVKDIDTLGISLATQKAFLTAINSLSISPDFILFDAFGLSSWPSRQQKAIIHGDAQSLTIAAASIIAKVYRDQIMCDIDANFPYYNFKQNKGYGTKAHRGAIKKYGLTNLHRHSFNLQKFL